MQASCYPPAIPDIPRVTSIKILVLGVVFTNHLSVSEHVRGVVSMCTVAPCTRSLALSRHEWRRAEGHLQVGGARQVTVCVFCMVGVHDIVRQKADWNDCAARCSTQSVRSWRPTAAEIVDNLDDTLFISVLNNVHNVLSKSMSSLWLVQLYDGYFINNLRLLPCRRRDSNCT